MKNLTGDRERGAVGMGQRGLDLLDGDEKQLANATVD